MFAILFNKPFVAYCNVSRGAARFISLLKLFGLEDRLILDSSRVDTEHMLRPIDWDIINAKLKSLRKQSIEFLASSLKGDGGKGDRSSPGGLVRGATLAPTVAAGPSEDHPLKTLCTGCGVCVSESSGTLSMTWDDNGFLVPRRKSGEVSASAIKVCPFNPKPEKVVEDEDALGRIFLRDADRYDPRAGRFIGAYIGYSRTFRPTSSSGGVATYVCQQLLERGDVDYLYVVKSDGGSGYQYRVVRKGDDLVSASKTRYYPVSLDGLFTTIEQTEGRVAVSGVACFVKAVRLKQYYRPELKDRIRFLIGIVCGGLKSRYYTDFLAQSAGIEGPYIKPEYRMKKAENSAMDYSFSAIDKHSRVRTVRMKPLGDMWGTGLFKAKACDFCTDVLTELADISLGDAWLPAYIKDGLGNSIVVTRSTLAETIIQSGIASGDLVFDAAPIGQIANSQLGGYNHKHNAVKYRVWVAKQFQNIPLPVVRTRLMRDVSAADAVVQLYRERTRYKSLLHWKDSKEAKVFAIKMRSSFKNLAIATAARRSGGNGALVDLLTTAGPDVLHGTLPQAAKRLPVLRWLSRKARAGQFCIEALREAPLEPAASLASLRN